MAEPDRMTSSERLRTIACILGYICTISIVGVLAGCSRGSPEAYDLTCLLWCLLPFGLAVMFFWIGCVWKPSQRITEVMPSEGQPSSPPQSNIDRVAVVFTC